MLRFAALWLLVRVGGRLPVRALYAVADIGGFAAWVLAPRLRRVTADHARHVLGAGAPPRDVGRTSRGCVRNAARYYADFARAAHRPPRQALDELQEVEGVEHFFEAYDRGCGMIVCSAHLGNPEFLTRAVAGLGLPLVVLTERLEPPRVHDFVHEIRAGPNVEFLPADLGGVRRAIAHVRAGGILALLVDRDVLGTGRPVPFFGERARLPSGAVEIGLRTGAPLLPAAVYRSGRRGGAAYRVVIEPPIDIEGPARDPAAIAAGMRRLAAAIERGVRRAPEQWFALQPIWRGIPDS